MADDRGEGFLTPIALTGPFPSGAPAIFVDQCARLGQPAAIVSAIGNDDFGRLNLERLKADGVDTSAIYIDDDRPTGTAFVRYRHDGRRDFVFNIAHAACGKLHRGDATDRVLASADHIHVMGSSLSSPEFSGFVVSSAQSVKKRGGTVSFDPNMRKEILNANGIKEAMASVLAVTDLYLPSDEELFLLGDSSDIDAAVTQLLSGGISAVVHKRGVKGATYYDSNRSHTVSAYPVVEVDPTGAGDCFGATFATMWLRGTDPETALRLAAAAGALAVTRRGPMEGASDMSALTDLINTSKSAS
ncbi:sugar kinase [Rhizobium aquaticum]